MAHYSARAKGGVGLIVTEVVTVEPTYVYLPGDMSIYDDSFIPGWKKLVDGVHQYGTKILAQLFHPAYMAFPVPGTPQLIAPSCVGPYYAQSAPRPATIEELHTIVINLVKQLTVYKLPVVMVLKFNVLMPTDY